MQDSDHHSGKCIHTDNMRQTPHCEAQAIQGRALRGIDEGVEETNEEVHGSAGT